MSPSPEERAHREAEAHEAWARHCAFIHRMSVESLLTAEQAGELCAEDARRLWMRTFLGTLGVWG